MTEKTPGQIAFEAHRDYLDGNRPWSDVREPERKVWEATATAVRDQPAEAKLPLIGRDLVLIEKLAKQVNREGLNGHDATQPSTYGTDGRGFQFQVRIYLDGEPTGRIARVSVTLDRVEQEPGDG